MTAGTETELRLPLKYCPAFFSVSVSGILGLLVSKLYLLYYVLLNNKCCVVFLFYIDMTRCDSLYEPKDLCLKSEGKKK